MHRQDPPSSPPRGGDRRPSPLTLAASVVCAVGLAVTFPVLEVLGRHPEFFIARSGPRTDAVLTAALLGVVLPAAAGAAVAAVAGLDRRAGAALHATVFVVLVAALAFHMVRQTVGGGTGVATAALVAGAAVTAGVWRYPPTWSVLRIGAVVPLVAAGLFVLAWPTSRLVLANGDVDAIAAHGVRDVPVTLVVFDELPTASLLRGPDEIDAERFPNFAALADDAVWYRNATTVSDRTTLAIPSVFTGRLSDGDLLPIAADHPVSLFTLLGDSHEVRAVEPVTELCPRSICEVDESAAEVAPSGIPLLVSDVGVVSGHVLLPRSLTGWLPRIDQTWGDFGGRQEAGGAPREDDEPRERPTEFALASRMNESVEQDRRDDFRGVVAAPGSRPLAHLLHSLLPHVPYRILPSGQSVFPTPLAGLGDDEIWDDRWLGRHAWAQHLLQLGFVDRMLGELLDDLRTAGVYDPGLVIVTADHGVSFEPGTQRRRITDDNLPDVAAVPLFVKYPDGPGGVVDERPAEITDVVPTVLDVVGIPPPEGLRGASLLGEPPTRPTRTIDGLEADPTFTAAEADPWISARELRATFGSGWGGVYRHGPHGDLVGRRVADLRVTGSGGMSVAVDRLDEILAARPQDDPLPGVLSGGIGYGEPPASEVALAIAFDGSIVAVGRSYDHADGRAPFLAPVPPGAYQGGVDDVAVYSVERGAGDLVLARLEQPSR